MELVRPGGRHLHWTVQGEPAGRGVLLSHGLFCNHRVFHAVQRELVDNGYRVVAWDLPGHGRSDGSSELALPQLSEDLWAVAEEADLEHPVLLGQGLGGQASLQAALERPDQVAGLALWGVDPRAERTLSPLANRLLADAARSVSLRPFLPTLKGLWSHPSSGSRDQVTLQMLERSALSLQMKAVRGLIEAHRTRPDLTERLADLDLPAWVAWGAKDKWVSPQGGNVLLERLPQATGGAVDTSGHLLHLDQPDAIHENLRTWLEHIHRRSDYVEPPTKERT